MAFGRPGSNQEVDRHGHYGTHQDQAKHKVVHKRPGLRRGSEATGGRGLLGTCVLRSFDQKAFQIMLDIPEQVTPELVITIGVPKGLPKPPGRRPLGEVLHFERWG